MCGIAAQHGPPDAEAGERMLERLVHRGPDDDGRVVLEDAWLGQRRLSIVDVSGGHQPLIDTSTGTSVYLVGNGEVYNHAAIRERLPSDHFSTSSDNEVALHLIERDGAAALRELNGMFAFVIAGEDGRFLAARDPIGIKPLYWAEVDGRTTFGSEMGAFTA